MTFISLKRFLQPIQILSLDVAAGALLSGMAVTKVLGCVMPTIWYVALPLAVWVVYTADHLLDAWRLKGNASTTRHRFHYQHIRVISGVWIIALLSCLTWVMWQSTLELRLLGLGMGGLVLIHLGLVALVGSKRSWLIVKELGVAVIYTAGVWGGPWSCCEQVFSKPLYGLALFFLLLALLNLLIFSLYEAKTDLRDGHTSWVLGVGEKRARYIAGLIAFGAAGLGIAIAIQSHSLMLGLALIQLLMLGILSALLAFSSFFGKNEAYRFWGDVAFLLPGLLLLA